MKYLAVLGRLPQISVAELSALYGKVRMIGRGLAVFEVDDGVQPEINRLGGTVKLGRLLGEAPVGYLLSLPEGKIVLGYSDYSRGATGRKARVEAMKLKKILSRHGRSVRVLDNKAAAIGSAAAHHNYLGEKPLHVELMKVGQEYYLSCGTQNITAYAKRDQARPARDAKVGMLPPKLAQILINLCGPLPKGARVLDPFCGTGVVLQEALLMGYEPYGTDASERMVEYSRRNLAWISGLMMAAAEADGPCSGPLRVAKAKFINVEQGDATQFTWEQPIAAVACETYLGPPMSNPPAGIKLKEVKQECKGIVMGFLKNLVQQIEPGTPVVIAVPAWLRPVTGGAGKVETRGGESQAHYESLNILDEIEDLGYNVEKIGNPGKRSLLYYREGQVVARELIVLRKK